MTSIKAPVKKQHYQLWAGEVTLVIDAGNGDLQPLTLRANAMTVIPEAGKITPNDLSRAQQHLQMNVYKTMGEEYSKVKDVLNVTILFTYYMGKMSEEELKITVQQQTAQVTKEPVAANDPYSK
ncbi:hypothetical protein PP744_gp060 [Rhizobium phage RHph_N38]|uniref:Uncharacterized protein n=1 Tax=Rhizobium phage RHph_N38 TaxID=2509750 RepID=A0A7S5UWU0_9CAUD|nr:hypothetical protein PP744_gp060 [Rhizobium phage RHph_N38]QIG70523.1 hypothetical protein EVB89_060 [Rhizobium phage RHph_N38]